MTQPPLDRFFAPCPRGLEEALAAELSNIGCPHVKAQAGGVAFSADWATAKQANLQSRIASRILWQVISKPARDEEEVYALALSVPWQEHFSVNCTIRVGTNGINATVRSLEFITLRVKDAVCDRFRAVCLDMSGESLFKRGWRTAGEAPLRENLAAGILQLAGWQPGVALFDPMCGSGTFLIEAAQAASGVAPGALHGFAFEKFLARDASRPILQRSPAVPGIFAGSDIDPELIATAQENALNAGLAKDSITFKVQDAREVDPPCVLAPGQPGMILINPPYEERIGFSYAKDASVFFDAFAANLKRKFAGWTLYVLTTDMSLQQKMRLKPARRIPLFNGPLECRLYRFDLR